jgi:DNA adenine methylase
MNKPFLKWCGNKFRVLPHILPFIGEPKQYIEPFFGSMAVALNVRSDCYVLNDANGDLVNLYRFVVNDKDFINDCENLFKENNNPETYYELRNKFNTITDEREKSLIFVYLNRHCFNGLTRYNSSGEFNVPFGKYKSPYFPREEMQNYKDYFSSKSLVRITSYDFADEHLYNDLDSNTVVYFDPPYLPHGECGFTNYVTEGFTYEDQVRLRDLALKIASKGAKVLLSNHDTPEARELYSGAFLASFSVNRFTSAKGSSRKPAKELLAVWGLTENEHCGILVE